VSVLNRKLRRDLFMSKGMLAAIIAIIAVGTGCLVGSLDTLSNLYNAETSYYSKSRMADFWINLKKAPFFEVEQLTGIAGVSDIRSRIEFPVIVDLQGVIEPISGKVLSLPTEPEPIINNIVLRTGSYFTRRNRKEVIVSEKFAKARNITPGSYIRLILNGQKKKLFVVGTGISSEFMYLTPPGNIVPDPGGYGVFWIKREYAEDVFGFHGACNSVVGHLSPEAQKNPEPILNKIASRLHPYGVYTKTALKNQLANLCLNAEMNGLQIQATVLPLIFLGVAALVLNVVMIRLAEQQRTVIGTLKAIGVSNIDILIHFLKYGLVVGLTGGVLGCALGHLISVGMTSMYQTVFTFPDLTSRIYPSTMIIAIAVSVIFAILGTIRGVKKVLQLSPAEAMRPPPPQSGEKTVLELWTALWKRLNFTWQMVLRGLFRNKGRSCIGIIAACLGSAMLLLSLGMADSLNYMVFFQFDKLILCDYSLNFRDNVDEGALYEVRRLPGVTYAESQLEVSCKFYNRQHNKMGVITGIKKDARLTVPRDSAGNAVPVPATGLLMTRRLAKILDVKQGDTISFIPTKGLKTPHQVKIADIVDSTFGMTVYANYSFLNKLIHESKAISSILLKTRQTPEQKQDFLKQIKSFPKLASMADMVQQKEQVVNEFIAKLKGMTVIMVMFAAVIFFGSILNSSLISIAERQREIATFRVLGYQPLEVGTIFLKEAVIINMIGAVLGLPLGYYMLLGMAKAFRNDMYSMPCVVRSATWGESLSLALIFVLVAYFIIQRVINRMDWGEALKMKE